METFFLRILWLPFQIIYTFTFFKFIFIIFSVYLCVVCVGGGDTGMNTPEYQC